MSSPAFKVYSPTHVYVASCKDASAAAVLAQFYGNCSTVRYLHKYTVWTHGVDVVGPDTARIIDDRVREIHRKGYEKAHGRVKA